MPASFLLPRVALAVVTRPPQGGFIVQSWWFKSPPEKAALVRTRHAARVGVNAPARGVGARSAMATAPVTEVLGDGVDHAIGDDGMTWGGRTLAFGEGRSLRVVEQWRWLFAFVVRLSPRGDDFESV
jgi:hypothetical protein